MQRRSIGVLACTLSFLACRESKITSADGAGTPPTPRAASSQTAGSGSAESLDQVLDELVASFPVTKRDAVKASLRRALDAGDSFGAQNNATTQALIARMHAAHQRDQSARAGLPEQPSGALTLALSSSEAVQNRDAVIIRDPTRTPSDLIVLNASRASARDVDRAVRSVRGVWRKNGRVLFQPVSAHVTFRGTSSAPASRSAGILWTKLAQAPHRQIPGIGLVRAIDVEVR